MQTFMLTHEHVKLLRRMYVSWDHCEFGAPCIDPKRPYGNSDVLRDMGEILGVNPPRDDDGDWQGWDAATEKFLTDLHKSMEAALQVVLSSGSFAPGTYASDDYRNNWKPVG